MKVPPPCPWIGFPDLLKQSVRSAEGIAQYKASLEFLCTLSMDELRQCEREYPAPSLEWELRYRWAADAIDPQNIMRRLIATAKKSTSLK